MHARGFFWIGIPGLANVNASARWSSSPVDPPCPPFAASAADCVALHNAT